MVHFSSSFAMEHRWSRLLKAGASFKRLPAGIVSSSVRHQARSACRVMSLSLYLSIWPHPLAIIRNRRLNSVALLDPLRSVQFSSVQITGPTSLPRMQCAQCACGQEACVECCSDVRTKGTQGGSAVQWHGSERCRSNRAEVDGF